MIQFKRHDGATDPIPKLLSEIETLYNNFLVRLSDTQTIRLPRDELFPKDSPIAAAEHSIGCAIMNIFQRLSFFWFTNVYKTRNLIEGLVSSYNDTNLITWTLVGRSVLEHSAVMTNVVKKLEKIGLSKESYVARELDEINDILFQYSNGTRFNWDALLAANFDALVSSYDAPPSAEKAINVLTLIDRLEKYRPALSGSRVWYSMLSDFAHPNMASHSLYMGSEVKQGDQGMIAFDEFTISPIPQSMRAEFTFRLTLPAIAINLGNLVSMIRGLSPFLGIWLDRVTKAIVTVEADSVVFGMKDV